VGVADLQRGAVDPRPRGGGDHCLEGLARASGPERSKPGETGLERRLEQFADPSAIGHFTLGSLLGGISSNLHVLVACGVLEGGKRRATFRVRGPIFEIPIAT
jgi:hypothetical protein